MRHAFRSSPAESLIETLVAITVIVVSTTAALTVMRTALSGNELIQEKVVAVNLALEGLEALKNLRDSNYLLYSTDPENCWNKYAITDVADCSDGDPGTAPEISEGTDYYFLRNFNNEPLLSWSILPVSAATSGALDLYDVDTDGDPASVETQIYAQSGLSVAGFTSVDPSAFRRRFSVVYAADGEAYDATVTVEWTDLHGLSHSVDLARTIRNIY